MGRAGPYWPALLHVAMQARGALGRARRPWRGGGQEIDVLRLTGVARAFIQYEYMATVKATAFRFTAEDLTLLGAIQKHVGTTSRTEALRALLRYYVRAEGLEISKPKRPAKTRQ